MIGVAIGRIPDMKAAEFNDGVSNEYAYIDNPSFKADQAGAFCLWHKPLTVPTATGRKGIIGYGPKDASNNSFFWLTIRWDVTMGSFARLEVTTRLTHNGTAKFYFGSSTIVANTTIMIVAQSDADDTSIYINTGIETLVLRSGTLGATSNTTNTGEWLGDVNPANVNGHRLIFGGEFFTNALLNPGDQRQNQMSYTSGRVLTAGEITSLNHGGVPLNYRQAKAIVGADLVSHWSAGDRGDSATTIIDRFGNNPLTLVNMDASNYVTP